MRSLSTTSEESLGTNDQGPLEYSLTRLAMSLEEALVALRSHQTNAPSVRTEAHRATTFAFGMDEIIEESGGRAMGSAQAIAATHATDMPSAPRMSPGHSGANWPAQGKLQVPDKLPTRSKQRPHVTRNSQGRAV